MLYSKLVADALVPADLQGFGGDVCQLPIRGVIQLQQELHVGVVQHLELEIEELLAESFDFASEGCFVYVTHCEALEVFVEPLVIQPD